MNQYLETSKQLDYLHPSIQNLINEQHWSNLAVRDQVFQIYNYVRDEVAFGYNSDDSLPASEVLKDGYGQCNTKGVLFMALLRAVGVECRMHGFTIEKALQKGAITGVWYKIAPEEILHSWVEINYNGEWLNIEGFILDLDYLTALQEKFSDVEGSFCGYGVATDNFKNPEINWNESNTYIQKEGIKQDFGVYDTPDAFFFEYAQGLKPIKKFFYKYFIRHLMNLNVSSIRKS